MTAFMDLLKTLPLRHPGPGGAVAIVRDGEPVASWAWGFADVERRLPMTSRTRMPVCSLTKQFVCATLLDRVADPDALQPLLLAHLPRLAAATGPSSTAFPTVGQLCHNRSGLRDYWATTVLDGADPEGPFGPTDAQQRWASLASTHFAPGSEYAYANTNFRILADLLETHTGTFIGELLRQHVLGPVGMHGAVYCTDTAAHPGPCVGYDGDPEHGFRPAVNRVHWSGDAGLCATLEDLVAWERFAHRHGDDPTSLYGRLLTPPTVHPGTPRATPARYGFGLGHAMVNGVATVGHGGALRGWRIHRIHALAPKVSIVVMFNHHVDAAQVAEHLLVQVLDRERETTRAEPPDRFLPHEELQGPATVTGTPGGVTPDPALLGDFLDPVSQLAMTIAPGAPGTITVSFAGGPETVPLLGVDEAVSRDLRVTLVEGRLRVERLEDGTDLWPRRILSGATGSFPAFMGGRFHCEEIGSTFTCVGAGDALYGAFDGRLGMGAMAPMRPVGEDVWRLACPRSMDAPSPGDWTVVLERDDLGRVEGVVIGCWLARGLRYRPVGDGLAGSMGEALCVP